MMEEDAFTGLRLPAPVVSVFDRVISLGWYDGTTSGLALDSRHKLAFRFDLLDWGTGQELRVFALSPLAFPQFDHAVNLLSSAEGSKWPIWYPGWPSNPQDQERMDAELDGILAKGRIPEYAFASESRFEMILAAKRLTDPERVFLPARFDGQPNGGFDYWRKFLGLPA